MRRNDVGVCVNNNILQILVYDPAIFYCTNIFTAPHRDPPPPPAPPML